MRWRSAIVLVVGLLVAAGCAAGPQTGPQAAAPPSAPTDCTGGVAVTTADELTEALAGADPGAVIVLAPGDYPGRFVATAAGTPDAPITLCGPRAAVLDGGGPDDGYTLHLDGISWWRLSGFTVRGGQKGVMADAVTHTVVDGLLIERTGDEALHLRRHSSDNVVRASTVRGTGLRRARYGEGIYVGSAHSNWCELTDCGPDRSDRNLIEGNDIAETTAEAVDVKEGTSDGVLRANTFSGAATTAADSWVDVKGNGWTIEANRGTDAPDDGFQVHEEADGWGLDNTFRANHAVLDSDGYGINVTKNRERNRVDCDNIVTGAGSGPFTIDCA